MSVSENWGFAVFETERYKLVVDEDACSPASSSTSSRIPTRTRTSCWTRARDVVEETMDTHVRPFFRTPPVRPHPSFFTGGYDVLTLCGSRSRPGGPVQLSVDRSTERCQSSSPRWSARPGRSEGSVVPVAAPHRHPRRPGSTSEAR